MKRKPIMIDDDGGKKVRKEDDDLEEEGEDQLANDKSIEKFTQELKDDETKYGKRAYLIKQWIPDEDDPDEKPTLEDLRALPKIFINRSVDKHLQRTSKGIEKIGGGGGFMMFNTSSSLEMVDYFNNEAKKARRLLTSKPEETFLSLFALMVIMQDFNTWYHDFEEGDDITKMMTSIHKLWTDLPKKSDNEIGLAGDNARDTLVEYLKEFGEKVSESVEDEFEWF
jgi:hypothetical protein